jgi:hypothetical protein
LWAGIAEWAGERKAEEEEEEEEEEVEKDWVGEAS